MWSVIIDVFALNVQYIIILPSAQIEQSYLIAWIINYVYIHNANNYLA